MNPNSIPKRISSWVLICFASILSAASSWAQLSVVNQGGQITINDNAPATPYPSTNRVQGTIGQIEKVTVTLTGVTHGYPDDIDMILEGPDGTRAVLMSDAGGQFDLVGATFTLDSTASSLLPDEAQINSGATYRPANYDGGDPDTFIAATSPFTFPGGSLSGAAADLSVFNGKSGTAVNGVNSGTTPDNTAWKLYVADDTVVDAGSIRSWTLNLYMTPVVTITNTAAVTTAEDTPTTINVFVDDTDTPLSSLTLTASSSDTTVIPNSGLTFGGNTGGTNRTLTITPAANASGSSTITITAKDAQGNVVPGVNQQTIVVNVTAVNDAPTFLSVGTTTTAINQGGISTNILVRVSDIDTGDPATSLVLSAISSNPGVIPATNVLFSRQDLNGTNRVVQIAAGANTGTATITLVVKDSAGASNTFNITATVSPVSSIVGANSAAIIVPSTGSGAATPYPSTITIPNSAGLGLVGKAVVSLINVEHPNPADLAVLLVSPSGRAVTLMRGVGDSAPVGLGDTNDVRLTFDRDAGNSISASPLTTSTNRPSDLGPGGNFPAPAPSGSSLGFYSTDLDTLQGSNVNGDWKLYVYDANTGNAAAGQIAGGWVLQIFPAPTVGAIGDRTTSEDTPLTFSFQVGDFDGSVTNVAASVVNSSDAGKVAITTSLSGTTGSLTVTPAANVNTGTPPGTPIPIQVVAKDNSGAFTATNTFNLFITPVNDAPTQSVIPKQITRAGQSVGPVDFTIGDVETAPANLVVSATSDNPKLLPPGAIILGIDPSDPSGATRTITIFPAGAQAGAANIRVTVTDDGAGSATGTPSPASSSQTFSLTVNEAANPLFENTAAITINDNAAATPYPSIINVSGLTESDGAPLTIAEVQVTLFGITHPNPDDIDVLLVGPMSTNLILMSDVGSRTLPLNNVTLRFRQSASSFLPDEGQIVSGDYRPSNVGGGDFPQFGSPAANTSTLADYIGSNPNGDWKLYVVDDTALDRGGVISSWQLSIRTRPRLLDIPDQFTQEDVQKRFTVQYGARQPGVANTVTIPSISVISGQQVIDVAHIDTTSITNGDGVLTVILNPLPDTSGTNAVTLRITDPDGFITEKTFIFGVTPVNDPPRFSTITDKSTPAATPISITFTVFDPEGKEVTVVPTSSNQSVVRDADISMNPFKATASSASDPAATRTLTIVPSGIATGTTTITLTGTDADSQKSTISFVLTVTPNVSFANRGRIVINDFAPATPYPSTIDVSGVNGTVSGVKVILDGLTHPFPDDVDVLLVSPPTSSSPAGRAVMLMSDAGGSTAVSNLRLTFSAASSTPVPDNGSLSTTLYLPANYTQAGETDEMPSPAPAGPYSTDLTTLNGVNPNGQWKLFVRDDTFPDGGAIEGGWILSFQTAPSITQIGTQTTLEDTLLRVPFTVFDQDTPANNLQVTYSVNDSLSPGLLVPANLSLATNGFDYILSILPSTNRPFGTTPETNLVTVNVTDGTTTASTTFQVRVVPVDDPPQIGTYTDSGVTATNRFVTLEDTPVTVHYFVYDADSTIGTSSNVVVTSLNPALVPNSTNNIVINGPDNQSPGTYVEIPVTIRPATNQSGTATIRFVVSDRTQSVTNEVIIEVTPVNDVPTVAFPTLSATAPRTNVIAGGTITNVPVTISDVETPARNLILSGFTSDQALIPNQNLSFGGSGADRTVTITTVGTVSATNSVTVSIVATDENNGKTTNSFVVDITPPPGAVFANTGAITIPQTGNTAGTASPYPSVISVSGMNGNISRITVTIDGLSHSAPDDIDMLLVSPTGAKAILMSDAGGANPISNVRLVFDQTGRALPDDGLITPGNYQPTDFEPGVDSFPGAPAGPYSATLQNFIGTAPNGTWSLFVVDDAANNVGQVAFGWSLRIETAPTVTLNPASLNAPPAPATQSYVSFSEDTTTNIVFTISDMVTPPASLNVSFTSSNPNLLANVITNWISAAPTSADISATLIPQTNAFGTNNLTITVRRSDGAQSSIVVPMNITPVNDLPFVSRFTDRSTEADTPISVPILVQDPDTALASIEVKGTSSNQSLISNTNILVAGRTNDLKGVVGNFAPDTWTNLITLVPNANASGVSTITVTVQELDAAGNATNAPVVSTFNLTVTPRNHAPTITSIPSPQPVVAGKSSTNIVFSVADPDSDTPLTITASSSDQTLVRDADIVVDVPSGPGGSRTVRVTTQPGVQGDAVITLSVRDPGGLRASTQFTVRVTPTRERVFANSRQINIRDNNSADPYPSIINVSGFSGNVSKVTVSLNGFTHSFPDDVDVLLVSPTGQKAIIMSDAGGGTAAVNLTLKFDDEATTAIPDNTALANGTYQPANYEGTNTDNFVSPAPAGPYGTTLATLNGGSPNGDWSLYVIDDTPSDAGAITNGWSIGITTLPVLVGLSDVTSQEDLPARVPFTIAEESFGNPNSFTFSVSSTNTALVPSSTNNIIVSGTGTNRTVTVVPNPNANSVNTGGPTLITITEQTSGASASFHVTFTEVNDIPTITQVADQNLSVGSFVVVTNFNFADVETAKKDLVVTITSSDPSVIPTNNVVIVGNELRIFSGTRTGSSRIGITVGDANGGANTMTFNVTVATGPSPVFASTSGITINDNSRATPYPSAIDVRGVNGTVSNLTVTLTGFTHSFPDDVDILLVGPNNQGVVVLSDAGAGGNAQSSLTNAWLTFTDTASGPAPDNSGLQSFNVYKPTDYEVSANEFATPDDAGNTVPRGPYSATFSGAFGGINPNGTWKLYVQDDASPDAGSITGWTLKIDLNEVGPVLNGLVDVTGSEDTVVLAPFTFSSSSAPDSVVINATASNSSLVSAIKVGGSGTNRVLQISLVPNAFGSSTITVEATDAAGTRTRTFNLTVLNVADAPVLGAIADQQAITNTPVTVTLNVTDVDTALTNLTFLASASGSVIRDIQFNNSNGSNVTMTITPNTGATGNSTVTVSVSDGENVVRQSFNYRVVQPGPPVLGPISDVTTNEGSAIVIPLVVSDPDTELANLTFFGRTAGTNLIRDITFQLTSSNTVVMTITPIPGAANTDTVTVSVSDGESVVRQSFFVTIRPNNEPPVLAVIPNQTTSEDNNVTIVLSFSDRETANDNLILTGTSSNPSLVSSVTFLRSGGGAAAVINLVTNASGTANVTINVSDATNVTSRTFQLTVVNVPEAPVLSPIADVTVSSTNTTTVRVPLTVSDPDNTLGQLTFLGSAATTNLIRNVQFEVTSSNAVAVITLVPGAQGTDRVTVSVSDGESPVARQSFNVTVRGGGTPPTLAVAKVGNNLNITITGQAGSTFNLEGSTDLVTWSVVGPVTIGSNGSAQVQVPITGNFRFFRAHAQ